MSSVVYPGYASRRSSSFAPLEQVFARANGDHETLVRTLFGSLDSPPIVPLYLFGLDSM